MIYLILIGDLCSLVIKYEIIIRDFCSPVTRPWTGSVHEMSWPLLMTSLMISERCCTYLCQIDVFSVQNDVFYFLCIYVYSCLPSELKIIPYMSKETYKPSPSHAKWLFFRPYMYFTLTFCMHLPKLNTNMKSSYKLVTLVSLWTPLTESNYAPKT